MTNNEAISIITQIKGIITNDNSWTDIAKIAVKEALDLAIKALKPEKAKESEIVKAYTKGFDTGIEIVKNEMTQDLIDKVNVNVGLAQPIKDERPKGELKEYKPLELDYNVKSAVENLKTAYWSNDSEKYAKAFTEAEEIIVNAICHHEYIVCKRPQGEWINHRNDYGHNIADCSLCGKAMQWHDEDEDGIPRYCWYCGAVMKGKNNEINCRDS